LPEIRDNIKKGFFETQKTVNSWISTFKKRLDLDEDDEDYRPPQPPRPNQNYGAQQYDRRSNDMGRRSADMSRYDADPHEIGDDFSKLDLREGDHPPRMSSRPLANPNLFKGAGSAERKGSPASGRKVSFRDPPEEIGDMYAGSSSSKQPTLATKSSKWQPLSTVAPSPVTDNDPFSLGDSDDDKEAKTITLKDEENELPKTTAEATSKADVGDSKDDTRK